MIDVDMKNKIKKQPCVCRAELIILSIIQV